MSRSQRDFAANATLAQARSRIDLVRARAEHIETDPHGWRVVDSDGNSLRAKRLVLAAGTLGNFSILARSSLASDLPELGHGFMDHVSARVAEFRIVDPGAFRKHAAPTFHRGVLGSPRLIPSTDFKEVLPGYGHWEIRSPDWVPLNQLKVNLRDRRLAGLLGVAAQLRGHERHVAEAGISALMRRQRPIMMSSRVWLRVDVQQPVSSESRIELGDGRATSELSWAIGTMEERSVRAIRDALLSDLRLADVGLELVQLEDAPVLEDIFHMMGGTRMGPSGVVDDVGQLRVGANAFVAGASNFPNGGMANPTLTALALSELTIEHLSTS